MIVQKVKPRLFKAASLPSKKGKPKRKALNSNLTTNYELMLRLYLVNKEQKLAKNGLSHPRMVEETRVERTKDLSFSLWNNILQVINRANHLLSAFTGPKIEIITK